MPIDMKNVIADTYASLVRQQNVDKITVKALIEACGISRQTFYYHFQDMMDVIEWSVRRALERIAREGLEKDSPEEAVELLIAAAAEHHTMLQKLLSSQRRARVEQILTETTRAYCQEMLQGGGARHLSIRYADLDVALDFCAAGLTALMVKHCANPKLDRRALARQVCALMSGQMFRDGFAGQKG